MYSKFGILSKQTYDEMKGDYEADYDSFVLSYGDKITAQKRLNKQMSKLNKDMFGEGVKVDGGEKLGESLNAHLKELTMERLTFFDWETKEKLAKLKTQYSQESQVYKTMLQIRLEERKNLEKSIIRQQKYIIS